jgi:hypothetical protein
MMSQCEYCKHWFRLSPMMVEQEPQGECRRFPPKLTLVNTQQGPMPTSAFPPVRADWACGEFDMAMVLR